MHCASIFHCAVATCCLFAAGCTVCQNGMRTICQEPRAFSWKHDRRRSIDAYRQLADEVWLETAAGCPELQSTTDYGVGFRDGFVDYVYAGGSGEPPPVPPRHFWNVMLRAPDGKARADQWFAGYRHGARVARDGGYRELGTVDSSLVAMHPATYGPLPIGPPAYYPTAGESTWSNEEILPEPFSPPALAAPQMPPNKNSSNNDAAKNEAPAVKSTPADQADAFPDDPAENAAPADAPMPTDESATGIDDAENQSTGETSVSNAIAIVEEDEAESVILISAKQPELVDVGQVPEKPVELPPHSTMRFMTNNAAADTTQAGHRSVEATNPPRLTLNHLRDQSSATAHQAGSDGMPRSPREWKPAQRTTIRIHGDEDGSKTAPAANFIPYGVTFDR